MGKPAKAVAEALAHYIAGPLHALALEVAAHPASRALSAPATKASGAERARLDRCVATSRASAWSGPAI